jgi:shikimate dehydrogenase
MTTLVGVLGHPVEHSRSPAMHNAAFEALGLDWRYELLPVEPERFEAFVGELPGRGFVGANVTIPYKLRALELAGSATEIARATGAANTLTFGGAGGAGGIEAHNTDVEGFLRALRERAPKAPAGMEAAVLGAGGAARAVVYALLREKAARIGVWNRHPERAEELVRALAPYAGDTALEAIPEPDLARAALLVNATSVGMPTSDVKTASALNERDFKELPTSADVWGDRLIVVDLVYRQDGTSLVRLARSRGLRCVDGFDVLVHQGAESFRLWTGREAPLEAMRSGAKHGTTD